MVRRARRRVRCLHAALTAAIKGRRAYARRDRAAARRFEGSGLARGVAAGAVLVRHPESKSDRARRGERRRGRSRARRHRARGDRCRVSDARTERLAPDELKCGNAATLRSTGRRARSTGHRRPLLRGTQKLRHAVFFAPIDPADGRRCRRRHFRFAAHNGRDGATAIGTNDVVVIDERTLKVSARGRSEALRLRRALYYRYRDRHEGERTNHHDSARGDVGNTQYDAVTHRVYVNVQTSGELVAIDPAKDAIVARYTLSGCGSNHGLSLDASHREACIACEDNAKLVDCAGPSL